MSTKFTIALCDTNQRANNILETFIASSQRFDSLDIMGGSRLYNNYLKNYVRSVAEANTIKSRFTDNYNMFFLSLFTENPNDIPKNNSYQQNMAEMSGVVVLARGNVLNKEYISRTFEFQIGLSLQEFILNFYLYLKNKEVNDIFQSMIREFETNDLTFAIFNKELNEIYVYNRGGELYINTLPGMNVILSTELLPINNSYPSYGFRKLNSECALKIDSKTMFVQYIPVYSNTFLYGKNINIDSNKGLIFTETPDMEYYTALSLLNNKDVVNIQDLQSLYFGFDTEIDKLVFDKVTKIKRSLSIKGKLPLHIKYDFKNIFTSESEILTELQKDTDEKTPTKKDIKTTTVNTIKDISLFEERKINFIASSLINFALEKGVGSIYIPNCNKHNARLVNTLKNIASTQIYSPISIYTLFDEFTLMDIIHYVINCVNVENITDTLVQCDRSSLSIGFIDETKPELLYNVSSNYNFNTMCAFQKCGMDNPFERKYIGRPKIDNNFINANIVPEKIFDHERRVALLNTFVTVTKDALAYQKKLLSYS